MDAIYWIWLQDALGYASNIGQVILEHDLSPQWLYEADRDTLDELGLLTPEQITNLKLTGLDHARRVWEDCQRKQYRVVPMDDPDYPERLRNIYQPPLVLYCEGQLPPLDRLPSVALVGTRKLSAYGCRVSSQFSQGLCRAGVVVVSGLAVGVDTEAHKGCVRAGGPTIAVLGCGLDRNYPAQNSDLRRVIPQYGGAIVTEYQPDVPPIPRNFPLRNRIISGLSLGVVVVEASRRSGSLITAKWAEEQNRDVFAVPTDIYDPNGAGVLALIKQGAKPATCVEDILEEYSSLFGDKMTIAPPEAAVEAPVRKKRTRPKADAGFPAEAAPSPETVPDLSPEEMQLFRVLEHEPQTADQLVEKSGLSPAKALSILTTLELIGAARSHPGLRFSRP